MELSGIERFRSPLRRSLIYGWRDLRIWTWKSRAEREQSKDLHPWRACGPVQEAPAREWASKGDWLSPVAQLINELPACAPRGAEQTRAGLVEQVFICAGKLACNNASQQLIPRTHGHHYSEYPDGAMW